jgi:hypothetical protein
MAKYQVEMNLLIHCAVTVTVEADDNDDALDVASTVMPNNIRPSSQKGWKAEIDLTAPKGIDCRFLKTVHFETANGSEKVRKV